MRRRALACGVSGFVLCMVLAGFAQDLDSNITSENRHPGNIEDEIQDKAERTAFLSLYQRRDPKQMLGNAQFFLRQFPQSAFLSQAFEIAARSSLDQGDIKGGLEYAAQSLELLPENPLLLVAAGDAQAKDLQDDAAISSARDALVYLDHFARPTAVAEHDWPQVKRQQQAIAHFVIGRAELHKRLLATTPELRRRLLADSVASLEQAHSLNPADQETTYLLGVGQLSSGKPMAAANNFASVYRQSGAYAAEALDALQQMYQSLPSGSRTSFDSFLKDVEAEKNPESDTPKETAAIANGAAARRLSEYAGSNACKPCHTDIYQNWAQTGMARMFRPYQPENVIGDFTKNNEFYAGGDIKYLHGKFIITSGTDSQLFARMVVRDGRHYFNIKQSDGQWHSYPVDYTIGSKWQQAYATKLPNGEIHVFPIQYNLREDKWLNYWKSLDGPGTERSNPNNFEKLDNSTNYLVNCATCHTSQLRDSTEGRLEADHFEFREPGVGCEMCHGPSALHIKSITEGRPYDKGPLDPPVDFRKISNRDFVRVCAQCHMQSASRDSGPHGELNYSPNSPFFRQYLSIPFSEFSRTGFYKDGRFGQTTFIVEALERSKCFRDGQVSCGNCHDPHPSDFSSNHTSLKFKDQPDRMCTGCHTQFVEVAKLTAHTHHESSSEGSRCVSCHMPAIVDALGFEARTHQIDDIPDVEMTLRFGQQDSPIACLSCHTEKTAQWVQKQLVSWKSIPGPAARVVASHPAIAR